MELPAMTFGFKIWFNLDGPDSTFPFLGEHKMSLLKEINSTGSIHEASQNLGLDFKKAWEMIESIHSKIEPHQIVNSSRGRNGGSSLTLLGKMLIEEYDKVYAVLEKKIEQINKNLEHSKSSSNTIAGS